VETFHHDRALGPVAESAHGCRVARPSLNLAAPVAAPGLSRLHPEVDARPANWRDDGQVELRTRPNGLDIAIAAALMVFAAAEVALIPEIHAHGVAIAAELMMGAVLLWRRVHPMAVCVALGILGIVEAAAGVPLQAPMVPLMSMVAALYAAVSYGSVRVSIAATATIFASLAVQTSMVGASPGNLLFGAVFCSLSFAFGWTVRHRTEEAARLRGAAVRLEAERAQAERDAATQERTRIAHELHDVISHSVSVMVVQASAAERVLHASPERARESLGAIQTVGRQALTELAGLLGVLRDADPAIGLVPQPGVADLGSLAANVDRTGVRVDLDIDAAGRVLPPGLQLTLYRLAQEALTNVRKHSCATRASVTVKVDHGTVLAAVEDPGPRRIDGLSHHGGGNGLNGIRERVRVYGGETTAFETPGGGYRVEARIPVSAVR
jgi:signal transduction histidine kinase